MKNRNGLSAFELLGDLDDGMIAAATLPEGAAIPTPARKGGEPGRFGRLMESGWVAAAASVVVAVTVLAGIVAAGQGGNTMPPAAEGRPLGSDRDQLQGYPSDDKSEEIPTGEGIEPNDTAGPEEDTVIPRPETDVNPDQENPGEVGPVSVTFDDGRTVYPEGYCVWMSGQQWDGNDGFTGFDADGPGAVNQLAEIADGLPSMTTKGDGCTLFLAANMTLQSVRVFEATQAGDYREMAMSGGFTDVNGYLNSLSRRDGCYVVVLEIRYETYYSADEYVKGVDEYAFRWTVNTAVQDTLALQDLVLDNGYMLWTEEWYDGGMVSGDGLGAEGRLAELVAEGAFDDYRLRYPVWTPYQFTLGDEEAPLARVAVYDVDLNRLGEAPNFTVLHDLPAGEYIVILTVTLQGDYIPEADAYERICSEYPLYLELYSPEYE